MSFPGLFVDRFLLACGTYFHLQPHIQDKMSEFFENKVTGTMFTSRRWPSRQWAVTLLCADSDRPNVLSEV